MSAGAKAMNLRQQLLFWVALFAFIIALMWLLGDVLLPFVAGNWIATLYLRYHYLIDVLAGFVVAFLGVMLARAALRLETRLQTT